MACHGFTQTSASWGHFGELLARQHRIVAVDLPGHGGSTQLEADLDEAAVLVDAAAEGEPYDLLGYSLGARLALTLALQRPAGLGRMVLIAASPGLADPVLRAERRMRDDALADQIEAEGDLEAFLRRWLAQPMFATLREAGVASRLANSTAGLAMSLRRMGAGVQEPIWEQLGSIDRPTLAMVGATDTRFLDRSLKMVAALPDAVLSVVPGARHACHLEQPALAAALVTSWLAP